MKTEILFMKIDLMYIKEFFKGAAFFISFFSFSFVGRSQDKPTAAPAIKTFAQQQDISGLASNSVNLYTGDIALPLNILSLPGHNGLDVSVSMAYSSNVQNVVDKWNLENPAGILGLGWSMDIPKIVSDHKQTGTREDDEYFLIDGGVSNQLIRTISGSDAEGSFYTYETKSYQFWKIKFYYDPIEMGYYTSGPNKWVILKEDGTKYVYGDKNSNRKTIQWMVRWANWIGNSSQTIGQSQFAYIWNLSEIINLWNEKIIFEYDNIDQFVGSTSGQKHTEASYLKKITDVWGRKVSFFYNDKQTPYYMEPHTEQSEPDAYQEYYEKRYLDHIDVLLETESKILTVQFGYTIINSGLNTVKMLLASIVQKNSAGNSVPGIKLEYYPDGISKGFLKTITFPTSGTVTYTYTTKTLGHSDRQFTATAPAGYAEPRVWQSEDFVVVAWRQLGSGGAHDNNPKDVKLYVYQWVGEWKEQFLQTIGGVSLDGDPSNWWNRDYKDFQATVQNNFFGVLSRGAGDLYHLFIFFKDQNNRGIWSNFTASVDYGTGVPTLMSGTNFIAIGSFQDDGTHPSHLYTYQGNSFQDNILNQTIGDHFYTYANNYFISHNRAGFDGYPEINFNYLTEDKKWTTKSWGSYLEFNSNEPSFWYSGNSLAVVMADDNPEYAYRWDLTYTNFYRDATDKNNNNLFGLLNDYSRVNIINNSLVGIHGRIARYDGKDWSTSTITSTQNGLHENGSFFSYGDDYVVRPIEYVSSTQNYKGGRKVFNPNSLNWETDVVMDGADRGLDFANAGIDYYYFGNGYYYRQENGTWVKKHTYTSGINTKWSKGGWPRFDVQHGLQYKDIQEIRIFKNGEIANPLYLGRHLLYNPYKFKSNGVGAQTIISYSTAFTTHEDATSLQLNRLVNDVITGTQSDYPVTLITINDGISNNYITLDYNTSTASVDPSGTIAQYHEVTEIPGSNINTNKPNGYTKTFFYNGLTADEMGIGYIPVDLLWSGTHYEKHIYDKNGILKASDKTNFQTYSRNIQNDLGTKVQIGSYVRPSEIRSFADNIETVTTYVYDNNTGLVTQIFTTNFDSKNSTSATYYKYFWEQYDVNRNNNILTPVIQTKESIINLSGEMVTNVSAATWKTWNNVFAPHKTYTWKRSGTADFNFSAWSETGEPSADWIKNSEINSISAIGNAIQVTKH